MRKDGRKEVTLTVGVKPNGKFDVKHFYGKTISEARRKRDEYKRQLDAGLVGGDITLSEWIDNYKKVYSKNNSYDYLLERLRANLGSRKLSAIREMDLTLEMAKSAGMSTSHISKYASAIKRVFRRAYTNRLILFDPSESMVIPQGTKGTHRALEKWEINAIANNWRIHNAGRWAMLMLFCGLRRGEMAALDWKSIDMERRVLRVEAAASMRAKTIIKYQTKTQAGMRMLPICEPLYQMLSETPEDQRVGLVCKSSHGNMLTASSCEGGWITLCDLITRKINNEPLGQMSPKKRLALLPVDQRVVFSCRMHDLRHTFATMLYDAGVDVKAAQYFLGHADFKITLDLYTHLSAEKEKQERANLVGFLDGYIADSLGNFVTISSALK